MTPFPETRISLILRLAEWPDVQAWQEFAEIYAPAIYGLALRKGLQNADAEDVTQNVLFGVAQAIERFQPDNDRASFRTWLSRIARNLIAEFCRRRGRMPGAVTTSDSWLRAIEQPAQHSTTLDEAFEREYRQATYQLAARYVQSRVGPGTWQAFYRTTIELQSTETAAQQLGMSVGGVYVARSRVLKMLREEAEELADTYSGEAPRTEQPESSETNSTKDSDGQLRADSGVENAELGESEEPDFDSSAPLRSRREDNR